MRFFRSRRFFVFAALVFVLIAFGGLLLLPEVLRWAAVRRLQTRIAAPVQIKDVDFNIFTGRARVSNLVIGEVAGRPIFKLAMLDFRVSRRALLRGQIVFRRLVFSQPHLFIERTGTGRLNVREMIRAQEDGRGDAQKVPDTSTDVRPITLEAGTVEMRDLVIRLPDEQEPVFTAQRVSIDIPRMDLPATRADVRKIDLVGAVLRLRRDRDGHITLGRVWSSTEHQGLAAPHTGTPVSPQARESRVVIRRLSIAQGRVEFVDETVTPTFTSAISQLDGVVVYDPEETDRANVAFQGTLSGGVGLEIKGWLVLSEGQLNLSLEGTLQDYELSQVSAYAEKHVKYQIRRGRVTVKTNYTYDAGQVDAESGVTLRRVELGEQLGEEFRERVGIPLKLALALLEDADGEIRLNIPVRGNVNNPEFNVRSVVWKSVRSAVLKALTAPLKLLGTIVTVGGKIGEVRIDPIEFLPGSLDLDPESKDRLVKLVEFLKAKPKVNLELRGLATTQESEALKRRKLRERIETAKDKTYEDGLRRLFQAGTGEESPAVSTQMMENYLLRRIVVSDEDLEKLAEDRERTIEGTLVREGVDAGRLFVLSKEKGAVTETPPGRVEIEILD